MWLTFFCDKENCDQIKKTNCDQTKKEKKCDQTKKKIGTKLKKEHRKNCKKLPWELVGCQGVEVIKKIVTKLKNSNCEKKP